MSNTKDTDDYDYFKFIPGQMIFGFDCYCAFHRMPKDLKELSFF